MPSAMAFVPRGSATENPLASGLAARNSGIAMGGATSKKVSKSPMPWKPGFKPAPRRNMWESMWWMDIS